MPTTTNFGWTTPADTDLVKDGAAAIRTLAGNIDTSLIDLKGGTTGQVLAKATNTDLDFSWVAQDDSNAIQNAIIDAKGDLIVGTAADTPARLAIGGTNGHVLTVDSAEASGMKWAAVAAGGGVTLLSTTTLSGTTTTVTGISQSYKELLIVLRGVYMSADSSDIYIRFEGDSSNHSYCDFGVTSTTLRESSGRLSGDAVILRSGTNSGISYQGTSMIRVYNYTSTGIKSYQAQYMGMNNAGQRLGGSVAGTYYGTSAVDEISILGGSTFNGGSMQIYGVN